MDNTEAGSWGFPFFCLSSRALIHLAEQPIRVFFSAIGSAADSTFSISQNAVNNGPISANGVG